jgi:hypothetical protein
MPVRPDDTVGLKLQKRIHDIICSPRTEFEILVHLSMYAVLACNPFVLPLRQRPEDYSLLLIAVAAKFVVLLFVSFY